MGNKCLFLSSIPFDDANVTANQETDGLPVTNLQLQEPERVWRATNQTPRLVIQLAAVRTCTGVAVCNHNGGSGATYRVQGGTSMDSVTGVSSPTLDTGFISMWPASGKPTTDLELDGYAALSSLAHFTNPDALDWWSVEFDDTGNPDPFEAGRVMIDDAFLPQINIGGQIKFEVGTKSQQRTGDFNRTFTEERGPASRKMTLPFNMINKSDFRKQLFNFQMRHTNVKDFFFSLDPGAQEDFLMYSMQALFGGLSEFSRQLAFDTDGGLWQGSLILIEQT